MAAEFDVQDRARSGWILILTFLGMLCVPMAVMVVGTASEISPREKRRLAVQPGVPDSWATFVSYPVRFEAWVRDHLGLRELLIHWNSRLKVEGFGVSPVPELVVGKQGWLFNARENALEQYRGWPPLDEPQLRRLAATLKQRSAWLAARGIEYLVVVAPNKHSIYPQFMPDTVHRVREGSHLDQLLAHLERVGGPRILDLRPSLQRASDRERTYHRTDTHWNDLGAHVGYTEILRRLAVRFPVLEPAPRDAFEFREEQRKGGGLARGLRLEERWVEQSFELQRVHPRSREQKAAPIFLEGAPSELGLAWGVDDPTLPRAVMIRDSFADALIPMLSEHFERILYVRVWQPTLIIREKPEIVIEELVERRIPILAEARNGNRVEIGAP